MADVRVFTRAEGVKTKVPDFGTATFTKGILVPEQQAAELVHVHGLQVRRSTAELKAKAGL